jgi:hypothetical protein
LTQLDDRLLGRLERDAELVASVLQVALAGSSVIALR